MSDDLRNHGLIGGGSGDAVADDLLSGKTATTTAGKITGTIPIRAGDNAAIESITLSSLIKLKAPKGYYDGIDDYITADIPDYNEILITTAQLAPGSFDNKTFDGPEHVIGYSSMNSNVYAYNKQTRETIVHTMPNSMRPILVQYVNGLYWILCSINGGDSSSTYMRFYSLDILSGVFTLKFQTANNMIRTGAMTTVIDGIIHIRFGTSATYNSSGNIEQWYKITPTTGPMSASDFVFVRATANTYSQMSPYGSLLHKNGFLYFYADQGYLSKYEITTGTITQVASTSILGVKIAGAGYGDYYILQGMFNSSSSYTPRAPMWAYNIATLSHVSLLKLPKQIGAESCLCEAYDKKSLLYSRAKLNEIDSVWDYQTKKIKIVA